MRTLRPWVSACFGLLVACGMPSIAAAQEPGWPMPVHDDQLFWKVFAEQVELGAAADGVALDWDVHGWIGDDFDRLWLKSEGGAGAGESELEMQALYSRLISPFWDFQAGVRYEQRFDGAPDDNRVHLVLGLHGLAPYWFELEPMLFVSDDGDVSARIEATYDLLLSQRLVLQPEIEINLAFQSVEAWGVGSGLNDVSVALRARYEIRREIAPFVGVGWAQTFGETADLARARGKGVRDLRALFGLRIWF